MQAVADDTPWQLVHRAEPSPSFRASTDARQRDDGLWVYREVRAREVWYTIMRSTYDVAEPGVVFVSRMNDDNNLRAVETIRATNPCGEQPLPAYGCCNLGPLNLTRFVREPFAQRHGGTPVFDWDGLAKSTRTQVRFLDDVLDVTLWPLPEQDQEAKAKRRIGVGFTGLGDALVMLGVRYNSQEGRDFATRVARTMRDEAYRASVELARERGAFPLFDAEKYLETGTFASRLPDDIKAEIHRDGIRNSHLLSIAPTGTVSLAFADNASNGIEPAFSWTYQRTKRMADGSRQSFVVEDHAYRLYRELGGDVKALPAYFVSALDMSANDHLEMMAAVQPFVDIHLEDGQCTRRLSVRCVQGPLLRRLAPGPEGTRHLPSKRHAGRGAISDARDIHRHCIRSLGRGGRRGSTGSVAHCRRSSSARRVAGDHREGGVPHASRQEVALCSGVVHGDYGAAGRRGCHYRASHRVLHSNRAARRIAAVDYGDHAVVVIGGAGWFCRAQSAGYAQGVVGSWPSASWRRRASRGP